LNFLSEAKQTHSKKLFEKESSEILNYIHVLIGFLLSIYLQIDVVWKKTTDELHNEWKNRDLDWLYPNKQGKLKKAFRSKIEDAHHEHMKTKVWDEHNVSFLHLLLEKLFY
jgi:hypothetical protein